MPVRYACQRWVRPPLNRVLRWPPPRYDQVLIKGRDRGKDPVDRRRGEASGRASGGRRGGQDQVEPTSLPATWHAAQMLQQAERLGWPEAIEG